MTRDAAAALLTATLESWVADPDNTAEWTAAHEGRTGLRVAQGVRDYSTLWFDVGERTVAAETYLMPSPRGRRAEAYRYCLARNRTSWPAYIALDRRGDLYVMARTDTAAFDVAAIELVVGAVYEVVELAFPTLIKLAR